MAGMFERLEDDVLGVLELSPDYGYIVTALDLGFPAVRAVTAPHVNASGSDDRTALHAERAVALTISCFTPADGTPRRVVMERLRAYVAPWRRPVLVFAEDDGALRRLTLRGDQLTWPLSYPTSRVGGDVEVQASFVAPSGLIEDYQETTVLVPTVPMGLSGRSYPLLFPRTYPLGAIAGAVRVVNGQAWSAPTDFVARLWGPCVGPRLANLSTGAMISLPGLALAGDQYAQVDTAAATILLNGRRAETLYASQEWGVSTFWQLPGGESQVRYHPVSGADAMTRAEIAYRPATL